MNTVGYHAASPFATGSVKRNFAPRPALFSAQILPPCGLDDRSRDRQTEAHALPISREERLEQSTHLLSRYPVPIVTHGHLDKSAARARARTVSKRSPSTTSLESVHAVEQEFSSTC